MSSNDSYLIIVYRDFRRIFLINIYKIINAKLMDFERFAFITYSRYHFPNCPNRFMRINAVFFMDKQFRQFIFRLEE